MKPFNLQKTKSIFIKSNNRLQAGLACLASVIKYYGGDAQMPQLLKNSGASVNNITLLGLCKAARHENFKANGYKGSTGLLKEQEQPAILHIEKDAGNEDFIVVYGWQNNKFIIGDPQWGIIEYREDELEAVWKSKALILLEPDRSFITAKEKKQLKHAWFLEMFQDQKKILILTGTLGLVIAVLLIAIVYLIEKDFYKIKEALTFGKFDAEALTLLMLLTVVNSIVIINNNLVKRGIKSFITELNNKLSQNIFMSGSNQTELSAGHVGSLSKATFWFCSSVFKLVKGIPFFVPLIIAAVVFISVFSLWFGLIVFLVSIVLAYVVLTQGRKLEVLYLMRFQSDIQKTETLKNNIRFSKLIKLTNSEKIIANETADILRISVEAKMRIRAAEAKINLWFIIVSVLITVLFALTIWFLKSDDKQMLLSFKYLGWVIIYLWALKGLINSIMDYTQANSSFNYLYNNQGNNLTRKDEKLHKDFAGEWQPINKFSVEQLTFAFPGKLPVFNDFNFVAEKGKITVVSGGAGSGKSVMVSVLSRLLPKEEGEIRIDGKNWELFNDSQWRKITSTILQPAQLFDVSILENMGLGERSFEPEKIIEFCKQTGFDKFFEKLPNGYASLSNNISAGQKQLVALAAAIYRKPQILLLDDPFAFMDKEMEEFCFQLIQNLKMEMILMIFTSNINIRKVADKVELLKIEEL